MDPTEASATRPSLRRRCTEAALAVALWMGLGWATGVDANGYLLLGVPLTVAFHHWVHRRPLHTLWVRDAPRFRFGRREALIAPLLAAAPTYALVRYATTSPSGVDWVRSTWFVAAIAGSVAAAFAFRQFRRGTIAQLLQCTAITGAIGIALDVSARLARGADSPLTGQAALTGLRWFLLYLPVTFVLEEVFFRGSLDAHVHRDGDAHARASAVFVAALWGLWHLPLVTPPEPLWTLWASAPLVVVVHVLFGVPLAIYWRRTGNLAVPATAHAFISAARNALQ
jgi:membrane protease YdiL (CAAX protease family)